MKSKGIFYIITLTVILIIILIVTYIRGDHKNGQNWISNSMYVFTPRDQNATELEMNITVSLTKRLPVEIFDITDKMQNYRGQRSIPKIIHQIWNDEYLPTDFVKNVQSLVRDNPAPEWKYYYWTKQSGLKFIKQKYPYLFQKANETHNVLRSDILRYLIIYEYGGVYFDLDTVSVQPLKNFVDSHICSFGLEPQEHYFEGKRDFLLTNSALLCVRKHPFYTNIILHLETVYRKSCQRAFFCTGPQMISWLYKELNKTNNYGGPLPDVQRSEVFQDVYDLKRHKGRVERQCNDTSSLSTFQKNICENWTARGKDKRNISAHALTYHTWYHVDMKKLNVSSHIKKIVPQAKIYGKDF